MLELDCELYPYLVAFSMMEDAAQPAREGKGIRDLTQARTLLSYKCPGVRTTTPTPRQDVPPAERVAHLLWE